MLYLQTVDLCPSVGGTILQIHVGHAATLKLQNLQYWISLSD
jgi:hypothetical protein